MRVREASQLQLPDWRDLGQAALSFSILQCSIRNITIIIITITITITIIRTITIIINLNFIIVECILLIQYSVSSQKRPDHWDQVPNVWYIHTIQQAIITNDLTDVKPINNRDHLLPTDQLDLKEAPCSVDDSVQLCHVLSCDRCLFRDPGVREFCGTLAPKCASYTVSILAEHTRPLDKKFDIGL